MPPRRGAPSINTLSPPDNGLVPQGARSPGSQNFPRSVSPSTGLSNFFSKPSKWFTRSNSSGAIPGRSSISSTEPRSSSSSGRKPKISHPTDPRPILDQLRPEPAFGVPAATRSVLDLSSFGASHGTNQSPGRSQSSGLGDLRNLSRKPWSKSADDLGKLSKSQPLARIDTSIHDRIDIYRSNRNDSVGSSVTPSSTHSPQGSMNLPFPTITTNVVETPSSSPPGRTGVLTAGSSPVSAGTPPLTPNAQSPSHVHTRSHSFTPRLPSKLSSPKLGLVPPSPKRKASGSETDSVKEKPATTHSGSLGAGPSSRPTFPFSFGSSSSARSVSPLNTDLPSPLDRPGASSALLAPPTIVEPGGDSPKGEKRSSQLIYHSGFINRLADFSPAAMNTRATYSYMGSGGGLSLSKGWKPFKLVLKGSKLYFYKPPSDRGTAVKELFPTEVVVVLEEGLLDDDTDSKDKDDDRSTKGKGKEREKGRKRAFWGASSHPALVHDEHGVERGPLDALIHEAVFTAMCGSSDLEGRSEDWQEYSSTILCALPAVVDRGQFEAEFRRCCSMLVDTATEDKQEVARQKVHWLINRYLSFHGPPADASSWDEWISKTVPNWSDSGEESPRPAGLPQSSSTQGLYAPTPELSSAAQFASPDLGAFSPRPAVSANNRMLSLLDALGEPPAPLTMPSHPKPWHSVLERGGFSREVLIGLDPQLIARSLYVHNLRALQQAPQVITVTVLSNSEEPPEADPASAKSPSLAPFFGSEEQPHWLTKLVLFQILMSESSAMQPSQSALSSRSMDERGGPARLPFRADVIAAWARVGELARRTGDECSWRAIFAGLCSRPIARLDKVWKRVETDALRLIQSWVFSAEGASKVNEPITIPWAGEHLRIMKEALDVAHIRDREEWNVRKLGEAYREFHALRTDFADCVHRTEAEHSDVVEDVEVLARFWQSSALFGQNAGFAAKFKRIEQFMSLSLAIEPRRKGMFEPYYWTRPAVSQALHPLTPLLFLEPLPSTSFIDRPLIYRSRFESTASASLAIQDLQQLRETIGAAQAKNNLEDPKASAIAGTMIHVYDGELILLVSASDPTSSQPSSRAPSRPPSSIVDAPPNGEKTFSRNPSVRVKPGTKTLERKPSQLRRSSLPALSRKPSFEPPDTYSERPLRVLIQAGTLDRLVSVLVEGLHGVSVSVADDNGEMPLNDRKPRELKVDMADFLRVWWNTFRSIVTPHVFFELLRKKYDASQIKSQTPAVEEIVATTRSRTDVLESIRRWVQEGGGAQDALDDPQLYSAMLSFFNHPTEHGPPPGVNVPESLMPKTYDLLQENVRNVRASFLLYTMRPILRHHSPSEPVPEPQPALALSFGVEPPDIDQIDPADLVANLDAMAAAAFRNLSSEDLFITADILEVQTADRLGWFLSRDPCAISDEVEIQSIHSYLQDVEPSHMVHELSQDSIYRLLPPPVRGCIRAFMSLRKWLVFKLTTKGLGLRARQARMENVLKAIEIARHRTAEASTSNVIETPCERSFVEAVLTSAVVSVESRMYHRAWQSIASARGTTCDTLVTLLNKGGAIPPTTKEPLTLDLGWLLERVLEVVCTADILEETGHSLVNFDKRRSLFALLTYKGIGSMRRVRGRVGRDLERLNNMEQEVSDVQFDLRIIREDAHREAGGATSPALRRQPRPFQALVVQQQDKNKRDKAIRDRLSREKRQEQHKQDKREEYLNKAMHTRRPHNQVPKAHRNKKSVSSAFFQLMRPISSAFTSETASTYPKRTPAELDFTPSQKPAMVLDVVNARVSQFVNTERSFLFQVDTEDGGHYLLQALDKSDMKKWMETIERVSKMAAQRRLTYMGQNSKMQLSDHLLASSTTSRDPKAVFGVGLEELLQRESQDGDIQPGTIPTVISQLFLEVESRGLTEVGIYRIAGAHSEVGVLRDALNRGEWPIDRYTDINAVCDLIKSWFRVLPGGMFPPPTHLKIMDAAAMNEADLDTKLAKIREVVHELPRPHFDLLKRLVEHLDRVTDFEESNQMTAESLSTVFSPNLLRSADDDVGFFFAHMGHAHRATKLLISHAHTIFDDVEQDLDADQDAESEDEYEHFDAPIPEEDEEEDELMSAGHGASDDEEDGGGQTVIAPAPPVLDLDLPSPSDLSIPMPS